MPEIFTILSANMNWSNYKLISLLETTDASCLLIQEPWWGPLVPLCLDSNPNGHPCFGTVKHPLWMHSCLLPTLISTIIHR
jgi:hypothetical protein